MRLGISGLTQAGITILQHALNAPNSPVNLFGMAGISQIQRYSICFKA
jgi:hypothetical protein